jgi:hypothetical protein
MADTDELLAEVDELTGRTDRDGDTSGGSRSRATAPETTTEVETASGSDTTTDGAGGLRDRLSPTGLFSVRGFLVALVLTVGGFLLGGVVPLVGGLTGLIGVAVAGFLLGLFGQRRYLELALAGGATGGVGLLLDRLVLSTLGGVAVPLAGVGVAAGLLAAVLGHYLGRDLHDGLSRDL